VEVLASMYFCSKKLLDESLRYFHLFSWGQSQYLMVFKTLSYNFQLSSKLSYKIIDNKFEGSQPKWFIYTKGQPINPWDNKMTFDILDKMANL